jgi:GTP-binding protein
MRVQSSHFERAVVRPADAPGAPGPLCVLAGRSNVGKSSLINRVLGHAGLARTSSEPGRTQSINLYRVNGGWYMVDLPGYGFARVPESVRRSWKPLVEGFLRRQRERLALALLVVDARRPGTPLDLTMRAWLESQGIPFVIVATKADKLNAGERTRLARELEGVDGARAILASARTGLGIRAVWHELDEALAATTPRATRRVRAG